MKPKGKTVQKPKPYHIIISIAQSLQSLSMSMASSSSLTLYSDVTFPRPSPRTKPPISVSSTIRCGPRSNRGPLMKGRILSIEAIQAIQSLKRAHRSDPENLGGAAAKTLSRLIKSDLLAALKELLRQDQCELGLRVFAALREEYKPDLSTYAGVVLALGRNAMGEDIDRVICDLEGEGHVDVDDSRGLTRLVRAVIEADRRESTVRIYGLMKRSGWGPRCEAYDYMVKVLSKGFKRLGEKELAVEVRSGGDGIVSNSRGILEIVEA